MTTDSAAIRIGLVSGGDARHVAALEANALLDSLWVGGHVASRNPSPEALMGLARLAATTERVKVGTSILLLPLYPPALVAKQIADLDRATDGRVILGVGVGGEYPQEFRALQVPVKERGRRADEMIPLIRRLWTAREITTTGATTRWRTCGSTLRPCSPAVLRSSSPAARNQPCAVPRRSATGGCPLPVLGASLRGVGRDREAGGHGHGSRPVGVRVVRVRVPQREPGRRRHT